MRAATRTLAALELLVEHAPQPVRVKDVAASVEVDPATASRLLATLVERGYASQAPDRRFTIGPRAVPLATGWLYRIRSVTMPLLNRVQATTGEAVVLSQVLGKSMAAVAQAVPGHPEHALAGIPPDDPQWSEISLWASAGGRAVLGALPSPKRPRLLPAEPYPRLTGDTATTWAEIRSAIRAGVRDGGVHVEQGEVMSGARCYAVPLVREDRGDLLAMSVIVAAGVPAHRHSAIRRVLRDVSRDLNVAVYRA